MSSSDSIRSLIEVLHQQLNAAAEVNDFSAVSLLAQRLCETHLIQQGASCSRCGGERNA